MKSNHKNLPLFCLFFLLILLSLLRYEHFAGKRNFGDFRVYYATGERLLAGESIYVRDSQNVTPYKYSTLAASFFGLLALLPEPIASGIWHLLNLFFLIASVILIMRLVSPRREPPARKEILLGVAGLLGVSPPVIHCLNSGQVGLAITFFYILSVYLVKKRNWISGSFSLAFSAMFKYLPILVLPYYWMTGKQKFVFYVGAWFLFFHLIPGLWLGFDRNLEYLSQYLPFLGSTTIDHVSLLDFKNQSFWAYLYRLLYYEFGFFMTEVNPKMLLIAGALFFSILYSVVLFSGKGKKDQFFVIDSSLLAILILIFNPNAWKHNFVLLLFPYLILVFQYGKKKWWQREFPLLLLVSLFIFSSNREILGWGMRFELMSASVLFLASMILFTALVFAKKLSTE